MRQVVRLRDRDGELLEFPFCSCSDSFYRYHDCDVEVVVIRRHGKLIKGHVYKKLLEDGKLVFEGDLIQEV